METKYVNVGFLSRIQQPAREKVPDPITHLTHRAQTTETVVFSPCMAGATVILSK